MQVTLAQALSAPGTSKSCWGALPQSTVSTAALEGAKSTPLAQDQEVSKLCCLCTGTRVKARGYTGSLSPFSTRHLAQTTKPGPQPHPECPQCYLHWAGSPSIVQWQVCTFGSQCLKDIHGFQWAQICPSGLSRKPAEPVKTGKLWAASSGLFRKSALR